MAGGCGKSSGRRGISAKGEGNSTMVVKVKRPTSIDVEPVNLHDAILGSPNKEQLRLDFRSTDLTRDVMPRRAYCSPREAGRVG